MNDTNKQPKKIGLVHFVYIIIILVMIIIALVSSFHCENRKFVALVSFAATFSSIILSVLAIFMSVTSNDSVSSLIHRIRDIHSELKDIPGKIKETSDLMDEASKGLKSTTDKICDTIEELKEETNQNINKLGDNLSELKTRIVSGASPQNYKTDSLPSNSKTEILLDKSSYWGLCTIYAARLAYDKNKLLKLRELSKCFDLKSPASVAEKNYYCFGYLVALSSVDCGEFQGLANDIFKINSISDQLDSETVKDYIINFITVNHPNNPFTDPEEDIMNIEQMFV